MSSFFTNRAKYRAFNILFNSGTVPGGYYAYLIASGSPTVDTNTWSDLSANESDYYGGALKLDMDAGDFGTVTEDDVNDYAHTTVPDLVFTAAGGDLSATWCIITDDNVTEGSRDVFICLDLSGSKTVSDTQTLTLSSTVLRCI